MDDLHKKYHITATTVRRGAEIEEASRKAVLALALPEMKTGLTRAVSCRFPLRSDPVGA